MSKKKLPLNATELLFIIIIIIIIIIRLSSNIADRVTVLGQSEIEDNRVSEVKRESNV